MENSVILLRQIIIMFLYIAAGYILRYFGLITKKGSESLSNLLLYVILPCVIIKSYAVDASAETTHLLLISLGLGTLALILSMALGAAFFHRDPPASFSAAFSNAGFMGVPLISAVLGDSAVFYIAGTVAFLNIFQWTYGQAILARDWKACSPKKIIRSPLVIAFLIGLAVYFIPWNLPGPLYTAVDALAGCNAPAAMIILGAFLREVSPKDLIRKHVWCVSGVRLLVIPAAVGLMLNLFFFIPPELRSAVFLAIAAPVGSNAAVYIQRLGGDTRPVTAMVCLSTLLSVVTMPLMYLLYQIFLI